MKHISHGWQRNVGETATCRDTLQSLIVTELLCRKCPDSVLSGHALTGDLLTLQGWPGFVHHYNFLIAIN